MINRIEQTYRELKSQGQNLLRLFSGNPREEGFIFPPEILQKSYNSYFKEQDYHPDPKGWTGAREAIAAYYARQHALLHPENLILTSGTSESFFYLFSLLAKAGDNILTPNPAYPLFDYIANLAGIELRHYPLKREENWAVDLKTLKQRTDSKTKAIVLVSPNNPTGSVISEAQTLEIADWANEKEIPLICDEVFAEFYFGEGEFPRVMRVAKPHLCFTLNGISKMFALPSMKLSWIAVTGQAEKVAEAMDALETTADTFLSCHTAIQKALPALFKEGWKFVEDYKKEVAARRALAMELLNQSDKIRFVQPAGAFYLMFHLKDSGRFSSEEDFVIDLMRQKGVFIHPGYFYDYEEGISGVISFLCGPEKIEKGLSALVNFIEMNA